MTRFAFYGRVSTEDQQDPASSRGWQLARSTSLIAPHDGHVVAEYFDIGLSRSLPWKRRPEAARLLQDLRNPDRGFDAVVIGEPARAFYGNQFGLTFPVFVHYGVGLWVPEVGGAVDPGSDAHDLVMSLYGGMSKGERNRIKIRVRTAMAAQAATEGRFLGGRPPYGYQLGDLGPHPNPGKAAIGQRQHQLEPDPVTAPVVPRIFDEYIRGRGLMAIASGLMADGLPSPSAHDPARNRHRLGVGWSKSAIRAILINPRYTGHQVWNKQRKEEILLDVEDVAAGHETRMRWNAQETWIWSPHIAHPPLITLETFEQARAVMATHNQSKTRMPRTETRYPYALRGLLFCGICKRKMQGNYNNGRAHYRCMIRADYVLGDQLPHPKAVYVREDRLVEPLDRWLLQLFDADNVEATIDALADAARDATHDARVRAAREAMAAHETKILKYRDAFDSGIDAKIIARWIADAEAEKTKAQRQLDELNRQQGLSRDDIAAMVGNLAEVVTLLQRAEPEHKTVVYQHLGVRLTYQHDQRLVTAQASPGPACAHERVRGGT
jgi:site-specific DNA recombinase